MTLIREEMYTDRETSEFFIPTGYEYVTHTFNFDALREITSDKFVGELEYHFSTVSIKKFKIIEKDENFRFYFYATHHIDDEPKLVSAYHNKFNRDIEYYNIDEIGSTYFREMELNVKITNKRKIKDK